MTISTQTDRLKIAILGGGPSALSAAFHLTNQPGWQDRWEITIYQMGWRLGGKGATGRDMSQGARVQEHGIHVFANMYNNTFHMIDKALKEVRWAPDEPKGLESVETAFVPDDYTLMTDYYDGKFNPLPAWLPHNEDNPWSGGYVPNLDTLVEEMLELIVTIFTGKDDGENPPPTGVGARLESAILGKVESMSATAVKATLDRYVADFHESPHPPSRAVHGAALEYLEKLLRWIASQLESDTTWRWIYTQIDFYVTILRGVMDDDIVANGINSVDGINYSDWLAKHGITDWVLRSALPQTIPNICFHYPDGDTTRPAQMSTSAYLMFVLRQFVSKGSAAYFFLSSTGETVILPLYRVLVQRGVQFAFFHKVKELRPDAGGDEVTEIDVEVQATVKDGAAYKPVFPIPGPDGSRQWVWPAHPLYEQLVQGEELRRQGIDLESWWTPWKGETVTLRKGHEFDHVILATSIDPIKYLCPAILALKPAWQTMVERVQTTASQGVQIWLRCESSQLGWNTDLGGTNRIVGSNYALPVSDFADFSALLPFENWPANNQPRSALQFCGPLQSPRVLPPFTDHDYPAREWERVMNGAIQYMRTIAGLLPDASQGQIDKVSLDFSQLVCGEEGIAAAGEGRMRRQWVKANIDPNERFVLTLPGSIAYRLQAWDSGVKNLTFCGDWVYTGFNLGSFEGAVMGGMLASHAISGLPLLSEVLGYDFLQPASAAAGARAKA